MPDNHPLRIETIASILKGRVDLDELRCEVQELVARSHGIIYESMDLITQIEVLLARR